MKNKLPASFLLLFFLLPLSGEEIKHKIKVMATIFPLYDFSGQIGGRFVQAELLIPAGVDIHHFEPRPKQMQRISEAELFVFCHRRLEVWADRLISKNKKGIILEAGAGLEQNLSDDTNKNNRNQKQFDPHFWLDLRYAIEMAERIKKALEKILPEEKNYFQQNFNRLAAELKALDQAFSSKLAGCRKQVLYYSGHQAFGYLQRRYHLQFQSIYGLSPDSEPSARQLAAFIRNIREQKISVLFFEPMISSQVTQTIVAETGVRLLPLHPGASVSRDQLLSGKTFLQLMEENFKNLLQGLGCE